MATEKGERRRARWSAPRPTCSRTGGFEAVRHRAVAEKAGLPLASTTYYFASLDDLVTAAVERTCRDELDEVRSGLDALPPTPAPSPRWSSCCSTSCSGARPAQRGLDAVLLRYEQLVGSGRRPYLAPLMRATRDEFDALLLAILARAGHQLDAAALHGSSPSSTAPS